MKVINNLLKHFGLRLLRENGQRSAERSRLKALYLKYRQHTMVPEAIYIANLELVLKAAGITGDIYECGVWKGGMIAGIAELLGNKRKYYLFDSFEGLPEAKEIDGMAAIGWQQNKDAPAYFDNCSAAEDQAIKVMNLTHTDYTIVKGWFSQSLPLHKATGPIAVLRLDGDWYESTLDCLTFLFPMVSYGGMIIIDDYYAWDGCARAVHDYLSSIKSSSRIYKTAEDIAYIIKTDTHGN
ncbi:TylF/MycF/NovP-related O-methyltransferase [Mucilaginibacter angelicae]|uniref:TylF/MycF/NovP-related O-methyltransferase n=1 Tax=Mucilaginibacter angelicae TaxID=869718 RepID=A0ABV6L568_9SPHI